MKNRVLLLAVCSLLVFLLGLSLNFENAFAQTADCYGTLKAWRISHPEIAKQYYCPHRYGQPVLRQKKSPTSGVSRSTGGTVEEQMINMLGEQVLAPMFESIFKDLFAPTPQVDTSRQEQLRKQQENAGIK